MKREAFKGLKKKERRIQEKIDAFRLKIKAAQDKMDLLSDSPANSGAKNTYNEYIANIDSRIMVLEDKKVNKEEMYYHKRRPAFFFVEGDPIPKDFHEFYTEMDSIAIDNVIARSLTKDPKAVKDMEGLLKKLQFWIMVTGVAAAAAAILAFTLKTDMQNVTATIEAIKGTIVV